MPSQDLPAEVERRFDDWRKIGASYNHPQDCISGWSKERLFKFLSQELQSAKEEERKRILGKVESIIHHHFYTEVPLPKFMDGNSFVRMETRRLMNDINDSLEKDDLE